MSDRPWWPPALVGAFALLLWLLPSKDGGGESRHEDEGHHEQGEQWWPVPPSARGVKAPERTVAPTSVAIAVFGGNTVDDVILDGWTIVSLVGPESNGGFALHIRKGRTNLTLRVTPHDAMPYGAPVRTDAFDYFYDSLAADSEVDDGQAVDLLRALSKIVEASRSD